MAENFRHGVPEDLSGWMLKRNRVMPTKKKRYFKLAAQVLSSHVKDTSQASWEQSVLGADVSGSSRRMRITVTCPDRSVRVFLTRRDDYEAWLDALQKASSRRIEEHYELGSLLGEGAFARVVMGLDRTTLQQYAVKVIEKQSDDAQGLEFIWRELNVMKAVNHPNIVRTYDIFDTRTRLYIVLEYMPGGTLADLLKHTGRFTEAQARPVLRDILRGVAYLHSKSVVHRDLKLKNILCDRRELPVSVKLADFGLANFVGVRTQSRIVLQSQVGSPHYVSPEVLREEMYGPPVDLWACGIIMHIILTRRYPFAGETIQETLELVCKGRFSPVGAEWDRISSDAKSLLQGLLREDPAERLTAEEALCHPWLTADLLDSPSGPSVSNVSSRTAGGRSGATVSSTDRSGNGGRGTQRRSAT
ncbi:hypothetical protein BU14_0014s0117 [Porphyra umbilicalis]|uniref:Protein kinase domain-containing protein n=1 Tax=Porphyra umbilicalis TaxID=2786 RepID=A0A1X6PL21_PORUM|nr:hypothetical protein BU14_0014s0117 [Porphyra umbilicalis]|eukprot:OSX81569.1 hypothetical protein BU14_0014s0117 [Porphyra umbilicalis]